jgi:hypothetical protein
MLWFNGSIYFFLPIFRLSDTDKQMFPCTVKNLVWEDFFLTYLKGIRFYLFKESTDSIPQALKRQKILKILHVFVVNGWRLLLLFLLYVIFKLFCVFN